MNIRIPLLIPAVAVAMSVSSCGDKNQVSDKPGAADPANDVATKAVLAERDSLIALFNDISGDMVQIKQIESIVTVPSNLGNENGATSPSLRDDILAIRQLLQERRQRLEELEQKLTRQSGENVQLTQMISNLRAQIGQNESTINLLTEQLSIANTTISELNTKVDSLNVSVADMTAQKDAYAQQTQDLTAEINKCYYAIGSNSELKSHRIIEKKFLGKTKIMQGDYEMSYFTTADKRNLTKIPLYSKKAKVWTSQPQDSYSITQDADGNKTLNITDPAKFWATSNFLVIQTD